LSEEFIRKNKRKLPGTMIAHWQNISDELKEELTVNIVSVDWKKYRNIWND
jgi:hypothetical protein